MKVEYINPFVESAMYVMREVLGDDKITRGKLKLVESPIAALGVAVVVGLTGQLKGRVIYDMDRFTAVKVAEVMNGEKLMGFDGLVRSTVAELANMITGNAVSRLNELGYKFDITPPSLFSGENLEVADQKVMQTLVIPLETQCGRIILNVSVKNK